jgi:hypothetical protein
MMKGKQNMKTNLVGLMILATAVLLVGCAKRSISNSGYSGGSYYCGRSGDPFYRGELSEFDVLGIDIAAEVTEEQIAKTLDSASRVGLRKGSSVLLIQSGAVQPDKTMSEAMQKQFVVVPFTGQPGVTNCAGYARALRLAAAQAGCETIVCYWGALESATKGNEAQAVSWVPVAGWVLPDQSQHMRINLKLALVDVRTGHWVTHVPPSFDNNRVSSKISRAGSDQKQVEKLKDLAYAAAAEDVAKIFTR